MKRATLTFPIRDNMILLSTKVKKVGAGFLNGFGGKIENELPEEAAARELSEESGGICCNPRDLIPCAVIDFFLFENQSENPDWRVIVYLVSNFTGQPVSTEEAKNPTWFDLDQIPYEKMLSADRIWLPKVMKGEVFKGKIRYTEGMKDVHSHEFEECDKSSLLI
jgi:8-oxo-dGTP diphosphatase